MRPSRVRTWLAVTLGSAALSACAAPEEPPPPAPEAPPPAAAPAPPVEERALPPPFEALAPAAYVAKVKNLLTGLPPTEAELTAVAADQQALRGLIDGWMRTPEFEARMIELFRNAFQQNQVVFEGLMDTLPMGLGRNYPYVLRLLRNIQDSFARTAWAIVAEGRPFHETVTTQRFLLTPPLAMVYSYMDTFHVNDKLEGTDRTLQADPAFTFKVSLSGGPIPLEETLDPKSPNYLTFHHAAPLPDAAPPECKVDPRLFPRASWALFDLLLGNLDSYGTCPQDFFSPPPLAESEFDSWRWVTLRPLKDGEAPVPFYDLKAMRERAELPMRVPRVGFFSTPAFHANWQTNSSNQARVTMNQVLIVALGKSFDGSNNTTPIKEPALDADHAASPDCYACHKTLDPMRQAFRQAYTLAYHEQTDPAQRGLKGVFAFGGVTREIGDLAELAQTLATHPRFALAWAAKLCNWANSAPCLETDPELVRVAEAFQKSDHDFKVLVRELLSSPLVTGAADTRTFQELGLTLSISRRDQLCGALGTRLGLSDPCGRYALGRTPLQGAAAGFSALIPADGYSRGSEVSSLANDPSLFSRAAAEDLCVVIAGAVVDPQAPAENRFPSAEPGPSMDRMVQTVMALGPKDRRYGAARALLEEHFTEAQKGGASKTDALRSTFVLSCLAPSSVAVGL